MDDKIKTGTIIVLAVLLISSITYIITMAEQNKIAIIKNEAAKIGYEECMMQVAQKALSCQQFTLTLGNQTANIVAIECLRK